MRGCAVAGGVAAADVGLLDVDGTRIGVGRSGDIGLCT
jgi:hypothetical protein